MPRREPMFKGKGVEAVLPAEPTEGDRIGQVRRRVVRLYTYCFDDQKEALRLLAFKRRTSETELVQEALDYWLKEQDLTL